MIDAASADHLKIWPDVDFELYFSALTVVAGEKKKTL